MQSYYVVGETVLQSESHEEAVLSFRFSSLLSIDTFVYSKMEKI